MSVVGNICTHVLCNNCITVLVTILLEDNGAGLLECVRVYGNLSQDAEVRKLIVEKKGQLMNLSTLLCPYSVVYSND